MTYAISVFFILALTNSCKAQNHHGLHYPDSLNKRKLYSVSGIEGGLCIGSMKFLQFIWSKNHERVPFQFYSYSKRYLQIDKFGHAYGAYLESYIGYHALRCVGVNKTKSLIFSGTLGIILQTPIEVWDGLYEGRGFHEVIWLPMPPVVR